MKKLIIEENLNKNKLSKRILICVVCFLGFLAVGRVLLANWLLEKSVGIEDLDKKISNLSLENDKIREELRMKQSLEILSQESIKSGFVAKGKISYMIAPPTVAFFSNSESLLR